MTHEAADYTIFLTDVDSEGLRTLRVFETSDDEVNEAGGVTAENECISLTGRSCRETALHGVLQIFGQESREDSERAFIGPVGAKTAGLFLHIFLEAHKVDTGELQREGLNMPEELQNALTRYATKTHKLDTDHIKDLLRKACDGEDPGQDAAL